MPERTPEERAAFGRKLQEAKAARAAARTPEEQAQFERDVAARRTATARSNKAAVRAARRISVLPAMAGASEPSVETRQYDAAAAEDAIRAAVLAAEQEPQFDQNAIYVVLRSCIARKKGPAGQLRDPLFYGDLVSKQLLAAPAVVSPADANRNCQEETDGIADLERFWLNGDIELPTHPAATEAIRLRALATAAAPENTPARRRGQKVQADAGRLADIRLHVVGNGGTVYGFASGELVG